MSSVEVSVEALQENKIQEVKFNGEEVYVQPLSMSENLTKLAHKIDFSRDECESKGGRLTSEVEEETEDEKPVTPFQPSLWPWDSVRNKLKTALTETSVLVDVLNIAREKHYMVLDPVSQEPPDPRTGVHLFAKKRALMSAASTLNLGADRLKRSQEQLAKKNVPDFHLELCKLRQNWRLKKAGNTILGDLSYKSAGSRYWQNGTFEVRKSDNEGPETVDLTASPGGQVRSALQVTVPSELEGVAYIQVAIKHTSDCTELASVELKFPGTIGGSVPSDAHWQRKLENAQNVIFCKEVFAQLAREATQHQSQIPHLVVGNHIFSHLFPGMQLSIALCHCSGKESRHKNPVNTPPTPPKPDHNHVLEHSLHQLMREVHYKNTYHPMPHPVTALLGMSKRRRLAGPQAFSHSEMAELTHSETLLEQIIKQARHIVVRKKTIDVIDSMAMATPDPQICAHWSNVSSANQAMIKVSITAVNYESLRTAFCVHIMVDELRVTTKEGRQIQLSHEEQELKDFILTQIQTHNMNSVHHLAKFMGWAQLSCSAHVGVGDVETIGNAQTTMFVSPRGDRVLTVRIGAKSGLKVHLQKCPALLDEKLNSKLVDGEKWLHLGAPFEEIPLDKIEGRTFCSKIETLMACVTS